MTKFLEHGEFAYHANGTYVPCIDSFNIQVSSTFTASKNPEHHQTKLNLTLQGHELDALITKLQNIRASTPASLPKEDYNWLNRVESEVEEVRVISHRGAAPTIIVGNIRALIQDDRHVWSGYEEGRKTREKHRIADLDVQKCEVNVVIPDHVWTITSSYFRGLFGESIDTLGGPSFRNKYRFIAKPEIKTLLMDHVTISYWKNPWHK